MNEKKKNKNVTFEKARRIGMTCVTNEYALYNAEFKVPPVVSFDKAVCRISVNAGRQQQWEKWISAAERLYNPLCGLRGEKKF